MRKFLLCLMMTFALPLYAAEQNVVIVLDDSGSMDWELGNTGQRRMPAARKALAAVVNALPVDSNVGLLLLNNNSRRDRWVIKLGKLDKEKATKTIDQINAGGSTPLGQNMKEGADALLAFREKNPYGIFRLLIVTDGEASDENLINQYLPDIMSRGVRVEAIGVGMAKDHSISKKVHQYKGAMDEKALTEAISKVFAETTATDGDNSDFELANAFEDSEIAAAVLTALSKIKNHPIGETPKAASYDDTLNVEQFANQNSSPEGGFAVGIILIVCLIVGIIIFIAIVK